MSEALNRFKLVACFLLLQGTKHRKGTSTVTGECLPPPQDLKDTIVSGNIGQIRCRYGQVGSEEQGAQHIRTWGGLECAYLEGR